MFTTYLTIYGMLTLVGLVEILTGFLKNYLGIGIHVSLGLFTIIFVIQFIGLLRQRTSDADIKNRAVYNAHRLTLILVTLLILIVWLFSI